MHFRDEKEESCVFCFGNRKTEEKMKKKLSKYKNYTQVQNCVLFHFFVFKLKCIKVSRHGMVHFYVVCLYVYIRDVKGNNI